MTHLFDGVASRSTNLGQDAPRGGPERDSIRVFDTPILARQKPLGPADEGFVAERGQLRRLTGQISESPMFCKAECY